MAAYKAMVRANAKREAALRGAELVTILGVDPGTLTEHELRSVYMSSIGAAGGTAAHASVEAAANALGVSTTEYFLAGGRMGVLGLNALQIKAKARDVSRRGGLSAATAGGAELVTILGVDPGTLSEHELRSIYMNSLSAAAHGSVEAAANALGVSTSDYFLAGGAAGVRGLNARQIQAKARDVGERGLAAAHASAAAGNRPLGGATKVSAPSRTLLIANCESIVTPDSTDKVTNRLYAVSTQ